MNRARLLLGLASVLAGTTVLLAVLGVVYNLFILVLAIPFGAGAYLIWADATGRIEARARARRSGRRREPGERRGRQTAASDGGPREARRDGARARRGGPTGGRRGTSDRRPAPETDPGPTPAEARRVLGVGTDADEAEIRRAYRERAKELHPDQAGGDEEAFKRATEAYERLTE